ncbi:MAG: hypothetical protein GF353_18355 [Candidatus Lokiarchaeota archaeon]|nr:hypothetical protein [Candidatus Lokiarchaeota archaeon]
MRNKIYLSLLITFIIFSCGSSLSNIKINQFNKAKNFFKKGRYEAAITTLDSLLNYVNETQEMEFSNKCYILLAKSYYETCRYIEAHSAFKSLYYRMDFTSDLYIYLAKTLEKMGKNDEAIEFYIEAKKKDNSFSRVFYEIGFLYFKDKDFLNSENNFNYFLHENKNSDSLLIQANFYLGEINFFNKKFQTAEKNYKNALKKDKYLLKEQKDTLYVHMATIYNHTNSPEKEEQILKSMIEDTKTKSHKILTRYQDAKERSKQRKEAEKYFQLAQNNLNDKNYKKALENFIKCRNHDSEYPLVDDKINFYTYLNEGISFLHRNPYIARENFNIAENYKTNLKEGELANSYAVRATEIITTRADSDRLSRIGNSLRRSQKIEDLERAIYTLQNAIHLDNSDPSKKESLNQARYDVALAYLKNSDIDKSLTHLEMISEGSTSFTVAQRTIEGIRLISSQINQIYQLINNNDLKLAIDQLNHYFDKYENCRALLIDAYLNIAQKYLEKVCLRCAFKFYEIVHSIDKENKIAKNFKIKLSNSLSWIEDYKNKSQKYCDDANYDNARNLWKALQTKILIELFDDNMDKKIYEIEKEQIIIDKMNPPLSQILDSFLKIKREIPFNCECKM